MSHLFGRPESEEVHCLNCGKTIFGGRSDRKFCNDSCRNTYNRLQRRSMPVTQEEILQEKVISALKRNHALLVKFTPSQNESVIIDAYRLHKAGFCYNYFTGCKERPSESNRYYCFEQYWSQLEYGLVEIGFDEEQLKNC